MINSGPYCDNAGLQPLTATPTGGVFSGTGVSGTDFDPSVGAGTYTVFYSYTDVNNCSATDSIWVVVQSCIGISKNNSNVNEISVFPNPATNESSVKFNGTINGIATAELMDVLGNVVQKRQAELSGANTSIKFNLNGISEGVYFVRVKYNGKAQVIRLIHN